VAGSPADWRVYRARACGMDCHALADPAD
jgi:hypothetical protein